MNPIRNGNGNRTRTIVAALACAFALAPAASASADDSRGEQLFNFCTQCHGDTGGGNAMFLAPSIGGLDEWYVEAQLKNFRSGARGTNPDDVGGLRMHPMSLWLKDDADLSAVAGYVAALPRVPPSPTLEDGDAATGAGYYTVCAACHGAAGEGNQALNAPPLAGASDWYTVSQLQKFKAGVRGGNPANPPATMMRGMAMSLADDQAIKDVVAHINGFSK